MPTRSASSARSLSVRVAALALTGLLLTMPVSAQDQVNSATIQWAQQILDQQGLYSGRATGKMDGATAAAISAYQRKHGLKATGRLDQGTVDRLLQDQPERKGVGNLADPGSRARPSQPILKESDVRPQAAPTAPGVERGQGAESVVLGASRGAATPGTTPPTPAPSTAYPTTAPVSRADVPATAGAVEGASPRSNVQAEELDGSVTEDTGFSLTNFDAPNWARYGLIGAIALVVLGMVVNWWLSGRRRRPVARRAGAVKAPPAGPVRREPTLGGNPPGPNGRRDPVFAAPSRDPHRRP